MEFCNKRFLVLGAGISGVSAANTLIELGAAVTLSDAKPLEKLKEETRNSISKSVHLELGRQDAALLDGQDCLVLSPGISIYHPLVQTAELKGIPVVSEIEVAFQITKAPILAITGTNGKTTTTTLIGEMIKTLKRQTVVGGNIGVALSHEVFGLSPEGVVVAEISSFQLEAIHEFRAHIAAILNMTPDHIDRHRNFETYQAMKERIFHNQQSEDFTVLNYDDPIVRSMKARVPSRVLFFSRKQELDEGVFVSNGMITVKWETQIAEICPITEMRLFGSHNIENALAACAVSYLAGVKPSEMARVLRDFEGVEHRIEPVAKINSVSYYNDSKATNPESSIKALEAFTGHVILIAGGRDKNTDLNEFMTLVREKVDHLILIGEATQRFCEAAQAHGVRDIRRAESFEQAVELAYRLASAPQVVLLSPACASYDMFNNYEERGRLFKHLVHKLEQR